MWYQFICCFLCLVVGGTLVNGQFNNERWNYVQVRPNANMFWWLYYSTHADGFQNRPLVLWLQGGPGASSTGYGNFELIGPRDVDLKPRNTTWLQSANLLFVDNPVGAGYSYATDDNGFTQDVDEVAKDLVTMLKSFMQEVPEFKTVPLYIFGESYGGKMGAHAAKYLHEAIQKGEIACNLKAQVMGDAWISPVDYIETWGPYLYHTSLVEDAGLKAIKEVADKCAKAVSEGRWEDALDGYSETQGVVNVHTNYVDYYNILRFRTFTEQQELREAYNRNRKEFLLKMNVEPMQADKLTTLMNGPIKDYLGIIPKDVVWGGQRGLVFNFQSTDFMKPVISTVDYLLANTTVKSIIYNGMLDLICDSVGTNIWVQKLKWNHLSDYNNAERVALVHPVSQQTNSFVKEYSRLAYYWVMRAGHMVPKDNGDGGLQMLNDIISKMN